MDILSNISIGKKLMYVMLILSIVPLVTISVLSYVEASNALENEAFQKLTAIKEIKANQIEDYFEERQADAAVLSADPIVTDSLPQFSDAFKSGINSAEWSKVENKYAHELEFYAKEYGYYDVLLIDDSGNVVYSVAKESDLGTNLLNGKYSDSNLADAYRSGTRAISLVDMTMYEASNEPAMFIAGPVVSNGKTIGVVAVQLPPEDIDAIMNEKSGMGETGETYLVGQDNLMRSDSRFSADSTILAKSIKTVATTEALAGKTDTEIIDDYRGVSVLSSYTVIEFDTFKWAVISEIDKSEAMASVSTLRNIAIVSVMSAAAIVAVVAFYFARTITKPVSEVVDVTKKIAGGDLTVSISNNSKDEIGQLSNSVQVMLSSLRELVGEVQKSSMNVSSTAQEMAASSEELASTATQISGTITDISKGTQMQSAKSQDVSKAMVDMTQSVQEVAVNSQKAAENSIESNKLIQNLGIISQDLIKKMDRIKGASEDSANQIGQLDGKSKQIGEIVNLITSIADQTNLLALNAAIEAARAGEHGKGFAVVADEVRKLAEESGTAAKEIAKLIKEMQVGTDNTVSAMKNGSVEVSNGAKSLVEAVEMVGKVVETSNEMSTMVQEIAAAAQEQAASIQEITSSVEEISAISEQSAAGTEETMASVQEQTASMEELAESAKNLSIMSETLANLASRFKL